MAAPGARRRESRLIRKARVRKAVKGTAGRPRLCVFRSLKFTYAQLISDENGAVICSWSTKDSESKGQKKVDAAKELGKKLAELAKEKKINSVTFDRNGYLYHGRVRAVAEGAREGGLEF
jgi:large subunit ribosomal protein L18